MKNSKNIVVKKKASQTRFIAFITLTYILLFAFVFGVFKIIQTYKELDFVADSNNIKVYSPINQNDYNQLPLKSELPDKNVDIKKDDISPIQLQPENSQATSNIPPQQTTNTAAPSMEVPNNLKVAYLTFDDGPSPNNTPKILDILKKENIKATFFVIGTMVEKNPTLLKTEFSEGHAIGNHTYSHNLNYNSNSPDTFMQDFRKNENLITSIIGKHDNSLIRFPGGSFGHAPFQQAARDNGYNYIDWNCLTGDAEMSLAPTSRLLKRFHETFSNQKQLVILMHDAPGKVTTPEALPEIIKFLKAHGYVFKTF